MPGLSQVVIFLMLANSASGAAGEKSELMSLGFCHLVTNSPELSLTAVNSLSPIVGVWGFLKSKSKIPPELVSDESFNTATVTLTGSPRVGAILDEGGGNYRYQPAAQYEGKDTASFRVSLANREIDAIFYFIVGPGAMGDTEGYDPYRDKKNCPNGPVWFIRQ